VEDVISIWHTPFEADSATNILFIRYHDAPPLFSSLERHFHVTQGFLPVGGTPSIMVVAPTTPRDGADSLPEPSTVREPHRTAHHLLRHSVHTK
jgi:ureidoglycolate hydrolase